MNYQAQPARLIGRGAESEALFRALAAAGVGLPRVALISGPAGIGKTALARSFVRDSGLTGSIGLIGGCLPLGASGFPYAPLVEALRSVSWTQPEGHVRDPMASTKDILSALVPTHGAESPSVPVVAASADRGWEQAQLFARVDALVGEIAGSHPMVLTIEDLHWADEATIAWLTYLVRTGRQTRLLVLLTYRSDELVTPCWTSKFIAETSRLPEVLRLRLEGLGASDLSELVSTLLERPTGTVTSELAERTSGNPFYIEQLCAASRVDEYGQVVLPQAPPENLAEVLLSRIDILPDAARQVLTAAALAGRPVHDDLLSAVCGLTPRETEDTLFTLMSARLVSQSADGCYMLQHALLAEVITARLGRSQRRRWNHLLADYLIAQADSGSGADRAFTTVGVASEIAIHCLAADDAPLTLTWSVAAAAEAEQRYAAAACAHYSRAVQAWCRTPDPAACAGMDLAELCLRAGAAHIHCDEYAVAIGLLHRALELLKAPADALRAMRGWRLCFLAYSYTGDSTGVVHARSKLLELALSLPVGIRSAQELSDSAHSLYVGDAPEGLPLAELALGTADARQQPSIAIPALIVRGEARMLKGDLRAGMADYARARDLAEVAQNRLSSRVYVDYSNVLIRVGRYAEAAEAATRGWQIAHDLGATSLASAQINLVNIVQALLARDLWREADAVLAQLDQLALAPRVQRWLDIFTADLAMLRGDVVSARTALGSPPVSVPFELIRWDREIRAELAIGERKWNEARAVVDDALVALNNTAEAVRTGWLLCIGMRAEADRAQAARTSHDTTAVAGAAAAADRLARLAAAWTPSPLAPGSHARSAALTALWEAEKARLGNEPDVKAWHEAVATWDHAQSPRVTAYAQFRLAEVCLVTRRRHEADKMLGSALDTAIRLHAVPLITDITHLASRTGLRVSLTAAALSKSPSAVRAPTPFGLTEREAQVLILITEGLTNAQIGRELLISPKTAELHVSHVLAKLGVKNRVQAAGVAHALSLASSPTAGRNNDTSRIQQNRLDRGPRGAERRK